MFRARLLTEFILLPPSKPIQKSMSFCLVYMNSESSDTLISTIFQGFAPKKFLHMMCRGMVGLGLSLPEPTYLKHYNALPVPTSPYRQVVRALDVMNNLFRKKYKVVNQCHLLTF